MNPDEIMVNPAGVAALQGDVQAHSTRLTGQLTDLENYLRPLQATWIGPAKDNFSSTVTQWNAAATDLQVILTQIGAAVGEALADLVRADQLAAQSWGGGRA